MERIQSAIAKAREQRNGAEKAAEPQRRRPTPGRPAGDRATAWADLPVCTPDLKQLERNRIVALSGGPEATSFDVMRTRTLQQMRSQNWSRLTINSPTSNCGKSMVSLNLALSLTRQPQTSVLLMEIDMRRPSLAKTLGIEARHSTADVLFGDGRIEDNAVRIGENLMVVTNHAPAKNPSDLLQGGGVRPVLDEIAAKYAPTVMLFDMPPLLANDDALAFLGYADCALLVASAGQTSMKDVDRCERELAEHTNVLGIILNKCRYMPGEYGDKAHADGYY